MPQKLCSCTISYIPRIPQLMVGYKIVARSDSRTMNIHWQLCTVAKTDTIGTNDLVLFSEVSLAQGLVSVDHTPPTIVASQPVMIKQDN